MTSIEIADVKFLKELMNQINYTKTMHHVCKNYVCFKLFVR